MEVARESGATFLEKANSDWVGLRSKKAPGKIRAALLRASESGD